MLFIYLGWLDFGLFAKIFKRINRNRIDDSKRVDDADNNDARLRALEEEARRREEASVMRQSYISPRYSMNMRRSQAGGTSSPSGPSPLLRRVTTKN
jgi:hypothetical protein